MGYEERYEPPSFEEVKQYAVETGLIDKISVSKFHQYYSKTNYIFKGRLIDWKQQMHQWAETETKPHNTGVQKSQADYAFKHNPKYDSKEYLDYLQRVVDSWGKEKK